MPKTIFNHHNPEFKWIDIVEPNREDLETIANEFNIELHVLLSALDPEFLPKHETLPGGEFLILRCHDEFCDWEADTTQELTRKLCIYLSGQVLISIHRSELGFVNSIHQRWKDKALSKSLLSKIAFELCEGVLESFDKPVDKALDEVELFEMSIFEAHGARPFHLKEGYLLKRKGFVFKRIVRLMMELAGKVQFMSEASSPQRKRFRENSESLLYYCEELLESSNSLLNLHLSLASQKTTESANQTNEVVRVLTIFSVFLLPLNVITGIYGMNFERMPELKWAHGYVFALSLMLSAVVFVYTWLRYKGWLKV